MPGDSKKIKWILIVVTVIIIFSIVLFNLKGFLIDYNSYLAADIEHRAVLFEKVVAGVCTGLTTFVALFITIHHENYKNRKTWEKEKEQEHERRLWSVKPFLTLESSRVSTLRTAKIPPNALVINLGSGRLSVYVTLTITNIGNGECRKIKLLNSNLDIEQIAKSSSHQLQLYFTGLPDNPTNKDVRLSFQYVDIWGTKCTESFICYLDFQKRIFRIELQGE